MVDDEIVAQPVEFAGGDARADMRGDEIERRGGKAPARRMPSNASGPWILIRPSRAARGAEAPHQILLHAERVQTVVRGHMADRSLPGFK